MSSTLRRALALVGLVAAGAVLLFAAEGLSRQAARSDAGTVGGTVTLSPPPGVYARDVGLVLRPAEPGGRVIYTLDGTMPSATVGTLYTRPVRLGVVSPGVHIVRAVEIDGDAAGPVVSASYAVGLSPALPVVSVIAEPADLWGKEGGLLANPSWRGQAWERPAHVTGFLGGTTWALPAGVRIDGREPLSALKQTLRLYFRQEYGQARLDTSLFPDSPEQAADGGSYKRLLLQAGDHAATGAMNWSLLRDQTVTELCRELGLPAAQGRFVLLFLNGSSWGIYRLTERIDRFYLADALGIRDADVVQEGDARDGSKADWKAFMDRVESSDLSEDAAYAEVAARVDIANLIDFAILSRFFDLPAGSLIAVQPQGGRWFWSFEGGSAGEVAQEPQLVAIHRALMANPIYRQRYTTRLADLLNTSLLPAAVERQMATFSAPLSEDYAQERGRWTGVRTWEDEVQAFSTFLDERTLAVAEEASIDTTLHVAITPPDAGTLYVNGTRIAPDGATWDGWYARQTAVDVVAVPEDGYEVGEWMSLPAIDAAPRASEIRLTMTSPLSLTVSFRPRTSRDTPAPDSVIVNELWINDDGTRYPSLGQAPLEGDWIELLVRAPGGQDLRGWRITDNATKTDTTEGSLILPETEALASVPCGTVILIAATESPVNAASFPTDDLDARDGVMIFYVGNGALDTTTDPGFGIGTADDNVVLLAPGSTSALDDDVGVDFVAEGHLTTPATFGVLRDGVTFDSPFSHLGADDGAVFTGTGSNDALEGWIVDPPACASGDAQCYGVATVVTPGALNPSQRGFRVTCFLRQLRAP